MQIVIRLYFNVLYVTCTVKGFFFLPFVIKYLKKKYIRFILYNFSSFKKITLQYLL